jgi:hypothetical protein
MMDCRVKPGNDAVRNHELATGQAIGAAGELLVQARLLVRGWTTGNVNSGGMMNAPAIDLVAMKGKHTVKIAVKSTGHGVSSVQWGIKEGSNSLFKGNVLPDFVIFVWFADCHELDQCRIFIVPAKIVARDVLKAHAFFHTHLKRDGSPRKGVGHVVITWLGNDTEKSNSRNFASKWKKFEEAWHILEK